MRIGIDSYCYHRYFGEIYPGLETDPGTRMTLLDVVERTHAFGADGVALESFMLGTTDLGLLRERLDAYGLDLVWAWGHPRGLGSGTMPEAMEDLRGHLKAAAAVGAAVMRICAGGRSTRTLTWAEHRRRLLPLLREAADAAAAKGIVLAVENHIDLSTEEMLDLITSLDHPALGICLDTANQLRMLEDPVKAAAAMAPYARAVHFKDVAAHRGSPREFGFWPSVPAGEGVVDLPAILALLRAERFRGLVAFEIDYLKPGHGTEDQAIRTSLARMRSWIEAEAGGHGG